MASIVKSDTPAPRKNRIPTTTRPLETEWLRKNSKRYKGQWVVLEGSRLVSHGATAREVYDVARAQGLRSPYVIRIPAGEELPSGGW